MNTPTFHFIEFNPRRAQRGAEGARVEVKYPDGETDLLWMSRADLLANLDEYPGNPELVKALAAYSK